MSLGTRETGEETSTRKGVRGRKTEKRRGGKKEAKFNRTRKRQN